MKDNGEEGRSDYNPPLERRRARGSDIYVEEAGEQVGGDAAAILGRRANVVDRRDLGDERAPARRRATAPAASAASVCGSADDGRRHAAERDARGRSPATPAITTFEIACAARVPTFRNHCRPRTAGISNADDELVGPAPRSGDSRCRSSRTARGASRRRSAARPPPRRPRAPAACRPPATRWRRCRRACRGSGSARRRLRARPRRASAARRRTSGERMRSVYVASAPIDRTVAAHARSSRSGVEPPEIQEPRLLQRAEVERHVQVGAPGHRHERPLVAQHLQRVGERRGSSSVRCEIVEQASVITFNRGASQIMTSSSADRWSARSLRSLRFAVPFVAARSSDRSPSSRCSGTGCRRGRRESAASDGRRPEGDRRHDHARRADAALRAAVLDERALQRMTAAAALRSSSRACRRPARTARGRSSPARRR